MPEYLRLVKAVQRWTVLAILAVACGWSQTSPSQTSQMVTRISAISSSWAGEVAPGVIDNRSSISRQNDYNGFFVYSASGVWSVSLNYSDVSATGPWTSFGAASSLTNGSPLPWIGYGEGYHQFLQFAITGNALVNYAATKGFYYPVGSGGSGGFVWCGPWSSSTAYALNCVVYYNNSTWIAVAANTDVTPGTNPSIWQLFVASGTTLPNGQQTQVLQVQPNTGNNSTLRYINLPFLQPSDYAFPAQSPGGMLTAGIPATITLAPVPLGVNGTDTNHYLYISTSPAEAVLITGGNAVSGGGGGTITFTPANSHASGWSIQSASSGIQEAWNVSPNVDLAPGVYPTYAQVTPPINGAMHCSGTNSSGNYNPVIIQYNALTGNAINIINDAVIIEGGCKLLQVGTPTSSAGIHTYGNGSSAAVHNGNTWRLEDISISGFYNGLVTDGGAGAGDINRLQVFMSVADNIQQGSTQGHWSNIITEKAGGNGITVQACSSGSCGPTAWMEGVETFCDAGWGVYGNASPIMMSGQLSYLGNDRLGELYSNYRYGGTPLSGIAMVGSGAPVGGTGCAWAENIDAPGIYLDTNSANTQIENVYFNSIAGNCIFNAGTQNVFNNMNIQGCGAGGDATGFNNYAIHFPNTGQFSLLSSSFVNGSVLLNQAGIVFTGDIVIQNSATLPALYIAGGDVEMSGDSIYQGGVANSILCASAELVEGANRVFGTVDNTSCTVGGQRITPVPVPSFTVSSLPVSEPVVSAAWVSNGLPGSTPCTTGSGAFAIWNGTQWSCQGGSGGSGTVTTSGSPASPNLACFSGSTVVTGCNLTGAVSTSGGSATAITATGVTAATYGSPTQVPQLVVNSAGQITSASNVAITAGSGTVTSVGIGGTANQITVTGTSPITTAGSVTLSLPTNVTLPGHTTIEGTTTTGATGAGQLVFGTNPTVSAPNITGHPTIEGVTSTGATGSGPFVFGISPTFTGTATFAAAVLTGALTTNVTGLTQCLQVNSAGVVSGVGAACGSGSGGSTEPGQTGSDFAMSITASGLSGGTSTDTLTVAPGNWGFGGNPIFGANACNFTLTAGTGTGVVMVWLTMPGYITAQYTNSGSQVMIPTGTTTNCAVTGAATPAFPSDGSKQIGFATITGAKTMALSVSPPSQQPFGNSGYFTTCTVPMICTPSGGTINVSAGSTLMQSNQTNTFISGGSLANVLTSSNCSSAASPAVCGSAISGSVAVPAGGATLVVDTSSVTANSQIHLTFDSSLGTKLSVTCNTNILQPTVSARTAATSFTITMSGAPSTNPDCISYTIIN